jgi:hypothetical protein
MFIYFLIKLNLQMIRKELKIKKPFRLNSIRFLYISKKSPYPLFYFTNPNHLSLPWKIDPLISSNCNSQFFKKIKMFLLLPLPLGCASRQNHELLARIGLQRLLTPYHILLLILLHNIYLSFFHHLIFFCNTNITISSIFCTKLRLRFLVTSWRGLNAKILIKKRI